MAAPFPRTRLQKTNHLLSWVRNMITETKTKQKKKNNHKDLEATTFGTRNRTRIAQWNVRTLREASRLAQLEKQITSYKIDVLGISEMRWNGNGEIITANGNTVLYSGKDNGGESGVGVIMSKKIKNSLQTWKPISDRVIMARFRSKVRHITIVQCYAPTEDAEDTKKDEFYAQVISTLNDIRNGDIVILMGDFNAKIGSDNSNTRSTMGKHGCGIKNNNGERLIELCQTFQLVIGGSIFPHKDIHKYTWTSPSGNTRNQIDHICVSKRWRSSLSDVRNRRGADIDSDHELITGDIRIKLKCQRNTIRHSRRKRLRLHQLQNSTTRNALAMAIREQLPINQQHTWEDITNTYSQVAEETLGIEQAQRKIWMSDNTWNLISQRKEHKLQLNNNNITKQQYQLVAKQVKKAARRDKRRFLESLAKIAEEAAGQNNMRKLHQTIDWLTNRKCSRNQTITDRNGIPLTNNEAQIQRWREHFEEISNVTDEAEDREINQNSPIEYNPNISCKPPSLNEIKEAIEKLKSNRAAGEDGIAAEILRADTTTAAELLRPHITLAWEDERLPSNWKKGIIVKLPKNGDLKDCNNWRGITLLNTIYKILAMIILGRLQSKIETKLRDEQAGFRPNRSCVDQANTLRIIIEQSIEWRTPLYLLFVDFKKAFDTIKRSAIWKALKRKGVPQKIIRIIKAMYENAEVSVLHNGNISQPFHTNTGVKQGCPLSPLLFTIVLDEIMNEVCLERRGITWNLTRQLEDLDYADDICLLSHKISQMQSKLESLESLARTVGLEINVKKTKAMRINNNSSGNITLQGQPIEFVDSFCYLGSTMANNGGAEADVQNRLNKARAAFGRLQTVWRSSHISRQTKLRIFNACVKSILLYGSETWLVSNTITQRLQVFTNKCLRIICKIFWPNTISNIELWNMTKEEPILRQIMRRKWRWIGHTLRKNADSITRMALEWNPQGQRTRGRPKNTWRRTIINELRQKNLTWDEAKTTAANRVRWKCFVEALCSQEE